MSPHDSGRDMIPLCSAQSFGAMQKSRVLSLEQGKSWVLKKYLFLPCLPSAKSDPSPFLLISWVLNFTSSLPASAGPQVPPTREHKVPNEDVGDCKKALILLD